MDVSNNQSTLQWHGFADIESGIQSFRIYRQNKLIGELEGTYEKRWNPEKAFHAWNYSDQPLEGEILPAKVFVDSDAHSNHPEDYEVSTVNMAGLESKRTRGISLATWNQRNNSKWTMLSTPKFLNHWQGPGGGIPKGWSFQNDILSMDTQRHNGRHTSLFTKELYGDFEFRFQFRIGKKGNSGVKYRMTHYDGQFLGPEYQILDDEQHYPGYQPSVAKGKKHYITATLYVLEWGDWNLDARHPPGTWNEGRIISDGPRIEHWINGVKIVETRTDTPSFKKAVQVSKFKKWPHYGQNTSGRIMLQDHGTGVEFKNLRIRKLE